MSTVSQLARPDVLALRPYVSARSLVGEDASLVFLDANEAADDVGDVARLNRYPEPQPRDLVARFAGLYGVAREAMLIGRGSDEAIDLLVRAFCRAGEDRVLVCPPTYGVYEVAAEIQGASVVRVPLVHAGGTFALDVDGIAAALNGVKIVFLCSPNNPTGTAFDPETLVRVATLVAGRALLVVDEAYGELSDRPSMVARLDRFPHLVVLRTLSKAWALAGARCGVALASHEVIALLHKVRAPYPLSTPAILAVLAATTPAAAEALAERVRRVHGERARVAAALRDLGAEPFPSAANFLLVRFRDSHAVLTAAAGLGVVVRDRGGDVPGCVRVTIGAPAENDLFLRAVREARG